MTTRVPRVLISACIHNSRNFESLLLINSRGDACLTNASWYNSYINKHLTTSITTLYVRLILLRVLTKIYKHWQYIHTNCCWGSRVELVFCEYIYECVWWWRSAAAKSPRQNSSMTLAMKWLCVSYVTCKLHCQRIAFVQCVVEIENLNETFYLPQAKCRKGIFELNG